MTMSYFVNSDELQTVAASNAGSCTSACNIIDHFTGVWTEPRAAVFKPKLHLLRFAVDLLYNKLHNKSTTSWQAKM